MKKELFKMKKGLLVMVMAAMALTFTACGSEEPQEEVAVEDAEITEDLDVIEDIGLVEVSEIGEGSMSFVFEVIYEGGASSSYLVNTDATTVGEALLEEGLIAGTDGDWGLMVESVTGVELDWDATGMYWAFYVDGQYSLTGVDSTEIVEGQLYAFVAE